MAELGEGDEFAGHRIEGIAGRGGMGVVYRARDLDLDRVVALKLIAPLLAEDPAFRERFIRETRAAASLDHPNVIPVFYAGEHDDRLYIAMRHVDGDDLRTLVRREGPLAPRRAARIVAQVASALDAAHGRGLVHRDVKPANVLLGVDDHVYLTDFGLTRRVASQSAQTRTGGWVGTLGYVAPEQIRGAPADARADVYALGCVLFHALTGATAFARDSDEATLWAHLEEDPPSVHAVDAAIPPAFDAVIARALAKDPDERFPSAGDLGRAALAAAGIATELPPERRVAAGDASWAGAPTEQPTRVSPLPEDEGRTAATAARTPTAPTAVAEPSPGSRGTAAGRSRRGVAAAALAGVVVAGAGVALTLAGGDDEAPGPATASTTATTRDRPAVAGEVVAKVAAGARPNAIAATEGRVFVASGTSTRLTVVSTRTNLPLRRAPRVGGGANALTAAFGSVWVAKGRTQTLLRYGVVGGARQASVVLPPGEAVAAEAGEDAVWVGSRTGATGVVAKVAPASGAVQSIAVERGVQNLAVGAGAVWVLDLGRTTMTRIDAGSAEQRRIRGLGRGAYDVAVGNGRIWVSNRDEGTVSELSARAPYAKLRDIPVGRRPGGIAYGAGSVWVANQVDGTLTRIDARSGAVVGAPIEVGAEPFAVDVRGDTVWVTLLGENAVARVRAG